MKITSLSAATLAAALLVGTASAGFPDEDGRSSRKLQGNGRNNKNKDKGGNKGRNKDKTPGPPDSPDADGGIDLIIKYKNENGFNKAKGIASKGKIKGISSKKKLAALRVGRERMKDLRDDPDIEYVEIDYEVTALPHVRGSDAAETSSAGGRRLAEEIPWGITRVNAGGLAQGSQKQVKVCVVDTGYDNGHPDLPGLAADSPCGGGLCGDGFTPPGVNLTTYGVWNVDGHGHGSHCAGTIGAIGNNDVGVTSVNPDPDMIDFFIGKGLSDSGSGSTSGVLAAAMACKDNGADIISMSLGGGGWGQSSVDTYTEIYDAGVLIIAAAGNGGSGSYSYPASYPQVMSVAATDSSDNKAGFSQWNDQVEIAGPGVGVTSTIPGGYATWSGTSMATPHVAGVAALVWSHFPECTNNHIREALIQSATDRGSPGCDDEFGFGIVNAEAAYDYILANPCQADDFVGDKSDHAVGGCAQDPQFTYPPTPAPTPFPCDETVATLEILTDYWGYETSWKVLNSAGIEVSSGGSYASQTLYEEKMCLVDGDYTLEFDDTYGDGICCANGYYKLFVGDSLEKHGGGTSGENFQFQEITPFTVGASPPTATPANPTASPVASPTASPVASPTASPTSNPTASPVASPTASPTSNPTASPTPGPTPLPTLAPVAPPTPAPVVPTSSPTASCETLCCFPVEDGGTGGWANDYMLGVCAAQGCHYETSASNGSPYCSGQNYYWTCMQSQCGVDPPTDAPVPPTPAPVVPPTVAPVNPPTLAPVVPPTPAPVSSPPTAAPTVPCPVTVTVEILTDNYPGETTWTVTDSAGILKGSGGPYATSGTLYTAEVCVDDEDVSFHISDSYGDGICCGYGQGSYQVSVGSRQVQAVGQFAHGEATSFGSACGATSVGASTVGREKKASGEPCKAHSDCLGDVCLGSGHCE